MFQSRVNKHLLEQQAGAIRRSRLLHLYIIMTIPFRCAEGTKRHETGTSNAAVKSLLELA